MALGVIFTIVLQLTDEVPLHEKLRMSQEKVEKAQTEEVGILLKIGQLERLLYQKDEELRLLKKTQEKVTAEVEQKEKEVAGLRNDVEDLRHAIMVRGKSLFKFSRNGMIYVVFAAESMDDVFRRMKFTNLILEQDTMIFVKYSNALRALEKEAKEFRDGQEELRRGEEEIAKKREIIESQHGEKAALLGSVREEKSLYRKALKEMEDAGGILDGMVGSVKEEAAPGLERVPPRTRFADMKGRLPLPAQGRIVGFFGKNVEPRYRTVIFRKGVLIDAKGGDGVRAIADGKAIYTGWFRGYGLIVLLDHGEGYFSLYGHLSRRMVELNQDVKAGALIGEVGDSGSLEGAGLYLEIRHHGRAINPLEWMEVAGAPN